MSRLAKKPIQVPAGVTVEESGKTIVVKGPKGEVRVPLLSNVAFKMEPGEETSSDLMVSGEGGGKQGAANKGTFWSLLQNAVQGVTDGFMKVLEIEGVGYRAEVKGTKLVLSLGYAVPVEYVIPEGISVTVDKSVITVSGTNKALVGKVAAEIREFKKPEPYKGKGIRYQGEVIRRKVGKKAGTGTE